MNTFSKATEALGKIGALLPLLIDIPVLQHLPDGLRLNTDDLTKFGIFTIEHTHAPEGAGNRNIHISTAAATDPAHPIAVCRSWMAPSGSVETISTTRISLSDVKTEVTAAIDWLRAP